MTNLYCREGRTLAVATRNEWYLGLSHTVRCRIISRWIKTVETIGLEADADPRCKYFLFPTDCRFGSGDLVCRS